MTVQEDCTVADADADVDGDFGGAGELQVLHRQRGSPFKVERL